MGDVSEPKLVELPSCIRGERERKLASAMAMCIRAPRYGHCALRQGCFTALVIGFRMVV